MFLNKFLAGACALTLSAFAVGCRPDAETSNANLDNANTAAVETATDGAKETRTGPDNTEITSETVDGARVETRVFNDPNSRVERVVVRTHDGKRTARVYYRDNTVRELPESDVEMALEATAATLVNAGGKVVDVSKDIGREIGDKAEDVGSEIGDKAEDVKDQTVKGAKAVGSETADKAEDVGDKTASGAKKVGKATATGVKKAGEGVKKAGEKVKDVVTP